MDCGNLDLLCGDVFFRGFVVLFGRYEEEKGIRQDGALRKRREREREESLCLFIS